MIILRIKIILKKPQEIILRILANGLKIIRYPENIARYYMLGHAKDAPSTQRLYIYLCYIIILIVNNLFDYNPDYSY